MWVCAKAVASITPPNSQPTRRASRTRQCPTSGSRQKPEVFDSPKICMRLMHQATQRVTTTYGRARRTFHQPLLRLSSTCTTSYIAILTWSNERQPGGRTGGAQQARRQGRQSISRTHATPSSVLERTAQRLPSASTHASPLGTALDGSMRGAHTARQPLHARRVAAAAAGRHARAWPGLASTPWQPGAYFSV